MISFKGRHHQQDIILQCVRWYVAYSLSYRDLEELMQARGYAVDHSTIQRWVVHYAPRIEKSFWKNRKRVGLRWRLDETYVKIKGEWKYLYRAVDKQGNTIDFLLTAKRDKKAALRFLNKAIGSNGKPSLINIDKSGANTAAIKQYNTDENKRIKIRQCKYLNNVVELDHRFIKRRIRPMLGFKSFQLAPFPVGMVGFLILLQMSVDVTGTADTVDLDQAGIKVSFHVADQVSRRWCMARGGWPRYVSAAEKRAKAERAQAKLRKKLGAIEPVSLEGRALANQWWGKAWNNNLEAYSDFANRLPRGRAYVRQGAVLDLKINAGTITALIQGSAGSPYKVTIAIKKISKTTWAHVCKQAAGQLESVQALLAGELPKALATLFNDQKAGLFPSPKQITLNCSCPDWADMCKHVAATLYGVGARLDLAPNSFLPCGECRCQIWWGRWWRRKAWLCSSVISADYP